MGGEYSEYNLIENSSANTLKALGWQVEYAFNKEVLGDSGTFGRASYKDVLLTRYIKIALKKFNPWITSDGVKDVINALTNANASALPLQTNEEKYLMLRDGVPVSIKKKDGTIEKKRALLFNFNKVEENHFLAIEEFKIDGDTYHRRADIIGFVNGVPLLFMEFKNYDTETKVAYTDNYTDYQSTIPQLFYYNAFVILSNGLTARVGTLGSAYKFFHEWKRLKENDEGCVDLETMLRGICKKENFLDLFENFIIFDHSCGYTVKILSQNHQYLGVNEALKKYEERKLNNGKLGVFWHTQGSGKSYSMIFLAKKILRKCSPSPTFIILTDRDELNKQISDTFENCGLLGNTKASRFIATSSNDLVQKIKANSSFIFTLIQKFNKEDATQLNTVRDIVIMSDEAHRSQYGFFANNMMALLPQAARIGFTGTPLFIDGEITKRTFGDYVSIYDFKRAVEDGATVPLYYENRGEKLKDLKNPNITSEILEAIESAELDPNQQDKIEKQFAKEIHILTAEPRLRAIARDFVHHYSDLWATGKAMFVCLNKVTCVRMYNYVKEYWVEEITALKEKIAKEENLQDVSTLTRKLDWMKKTQMAVVVSPEQNEEQVFSKWNLDIKTHRKIMENRELDKEFKDDNNPLRVVFVCAMWLTGFDVKCLTCLYIDKPLKAHTLMQTIARANRVNEGKENGLIIDYIGIVKALREALAQYTGQNGVTGGCDPTIDKSKLIEHITDVIKKATSFLAEKGILIESIIGAKDFEKLKLLIKAKNAICKDKKDEKTFCAYATDIRRLIRYLDRFDIDSDTKKHSDAINAIYGELIKKRRGADVTDLMVAINKIISANVSIDDVSCAAENGTKEYNISEIDFERLKNEFKKSDLKNIILRDIEKVIENKLKNMIKGNPTRIDYYEHYQKIIEAYNNEQNRATIEKTFDDLMELAKEMTQEETRYAREGFTNDEELALYDMLFKESLSKSEIKRLKKASVAILETVKLRMDTFDHCLDKDETKAQLQTIIRNILFESLSASYESNIDNYQKEVYKYVCKRYLKAA